VNNKFGPGIDVLFGIRKKRGPRGGRSEIQSIRFKADKFTPAQAKRWLREHDYDPVGFDPASTRNPQALAVINEGAAENARQTRADFMNDGRSVDDVDLIAVDLPDLEDIVFVVVGDYLRIDYGSDKFGEGWQHYYHDSTLGGVVAFHPKIIIILPPEGEEFKIGPRGLMN
jgi:hypothetical protein